jgi:hypothetical protein
MRCWPLLVLVAYAAPLTAGAVPPPPEGDDDEPEEPLLDTRMIQGWGQPPPFQRLVDLELIYPGFPDIIGLCAEVNPGYFVSLEGCAGTQITASSLSVAVKSRFLHYVHIEQQTALDGRPRYKGFEFGFGPGIGIRSVSVLSSFVGSSTHSGVTVDPMLSLEWAYWFSRFVGLTMQLDAGPMFGFNANPPLGKDLRHVDWSQVLPFGRLSIGVAF